MYSEFVLPNITMKAVGSGRLFPVKSLGCPSVLLFHDDQTIAAAEKVNTVVRSRYPFSQQVLVASVVDLWFVPSTTRQIVREFLQLAYNEGVKRLPEGIDPVEYVIVLPDWKGQLTESLAVGKVSRQAAVAVVDGAGNVVGKYKGERVGDAALQMLDEIYQR
ncbi:MAG: hypothetical protein ACOYL5_19315 [Phototrophicaceae bacterium]|jgi:hypothetical protein